MKFIGFIKEEDKNIPASKNLNEMFLTTSNDTLINKDVVTYLKNDSFLTGVMSYIYDNEGKPMGNLDYFTDGQFVWPRYYPYYLQKYNNFYIDHDLLQYYLLNNFKTSQYPKKH